MSGYIENVTLSCDSTKAQNIQMEKRGLAEGDDDDNKDPNK